MKLSYCREKPEKILAVLTFLFFGIIFCLISLVNHYQFRTYALDLGMFNHALYSFAHFKADFFTLDVNGNMVNYFGDHFSPITFLYVPFYYLFGSYTLLIIQIAAVLFGGYGAYKFAGLITRSKYLPLLVLIQFFGIWGIYSALTYDFHNNVVGAMLVPWLVYFYTKDKKGLTLLLFSLILIAKENMAIWLVFILLALMAKGGLSSWRKYLRFEIPLTLAACLYFAITVEVLMPALRGDAPVSQITRYAHLGDSTGEILSTIVFHPLKTLSVIFSNPDAEQSGVAVKYEFYFMLLTSGGLALLFAPYYLIALIPIYLQKFLTNDESILGINYQYSIEFVPILSLAFSEFLAKINRRRLQYLAALTILLVTFASLAGAFLPKNDFRPDPLNVRFFSPSHYQSPVDHSEINKALEPIPDNAALSVNSVLAPHLSSRDRIYHFPIIMDAEYIALMYNSNYYPLSGHSFKEELKKYRESPEFEVIYDGNDLIIFKKKTGAEGSG